jgi:predicted DNA-binding protein with PD1-like motif
MKYTKGRMGRVFVVKFDDGDIFLEKLAVLVKKEKIEAAALVFLGALRKGDLVTGPKKPVIPPMPNKVAFKNAWEVMGVGSIFTNASGPQIHIHTSMGQKKKVLTGCVRGKSKVFLVIEAFVFELSGVSATKSLDLTTGLNLLKIIS